MPKPTRTDAWTFTITGAIPITAETSAAAKKAVADHVSEMLTELSGSEIVITREGFGKIARRTE